MEKFGITGMSCASCSARVEKAVSSLSGIKTCCVNLLTNSMSVEGTASSDEIIRAVKEAGYGAFLLGNEPEQKVSSDNGLLGLKKRLVLSLPPLLLLVYVTMGHMVFHLPVPSFLISDYKVLGFFELCLSLPVVLINRQFFISGFKGFIHGSPNMDSLVSLGAGSSFIYSLYALLEGSKAHSYYFESAAMILTLITVGKLLEAKSKGKTTDALKKLISLAPQTAVLVCDGVKTTVSVSEIKVGDCFEIKPGDSIPVDGVVVEGKSSLNEAALTGESIPVDKTLGDKVSAGTINQSGYLLCRATKIGEDTGLAQIIKMVSEASSSKAPVAKTADKVAGIFVPVVLGLSLITFFIWFFFGRSFEFAITRAVAVLVISCPCALGLATPVAIMVGNGVGAKKGILFKNAEALEFTGTSSVVALDKTGTITTGKPVVKEILPLNGFDKDQLLDYAISLESKSEHPLAVAISALGAPVSKVNNFKAVAGNGLSGELQGKVVAGGNLRFISLFAFVDEQAKEQASLFSGKGMTPVFFSFDGNLVGLIAVADSLRSDSREAVEQLKSLGLKVVMLTGDNKETASYIGKEAGIDEVYAGILPGEKKDLITSLKQRGRVIMVGDGINDAPALTSADIGVAIGTGTDIAVDAADVVLMKNSLMDVVTAVKLSRATMRIIKQNLFWAFFYNVIGIPLAAGTLNPMIGAAAMSLSSFCVVSNALRLNLFGREKEKIMKITVKGMMCPHCEAHVKAALEKVSGVIEATADHTKDSVELKVVGEVSLEALRRAVEAAGYEFEN